MGLDVTFDCWSGAYSSFSTFRLILAKAADYPITASTSPKDWTPVESYWQSEWDSLYEERPDIWSGRIMGDWEELPEDPLLVLLIHSDCEGVLPVACLNPLADRLEGLIPKLPESDPDDRWSWRARTKQFVEGLREAAGQNQEVEFF